jgi:hypothetical protein
MISGFRPKPISQGGSLQSCNEGCQLTPFVPFSKSLQGDDSLLFGKQYRVKTILLLLSVLMHDDYLDAVTCIAGVKVKCRWVDPFWTIIEGTEMSVSQGLFDVVAASCLELNMIKQVIGKWEASSLLNGPFIAFRSCETLCLRLYNQQHYVCSFNQAAVIPMLLVQAVEPSLPPCELYLEGSILLRRVTNLP